MPSHPDRVRKNYIYICPICKEEFKTAEELVKHFSNQESKNKPWIKTIATSTNNK